MEKQYQNKHGKLIIQTVEPFGAIAGKWLAKAPETASRFDLDTAAKIALITDNRGVQVAVGSDCKMCGLVMHESASIVAWCKIVELEFTGSTPHETIEDEARRRNRYLDYC